MNLNVLKDYACPSGKVILLSNCEKPCAIALAKGTYVIVHRHIAWLSQDCFSHSNTSNNCLTLPLPVWHSKATRFSIKLRKQKECTKTFNIVQLAPPKVTHSDRCFAFLRLLSHESTSGPLLTAAQPDWWFLQETPVLLPKPEKLGIAWLSKLKLFLFDKFLMCESLSFTSGVTWSSGIKMQTISQLTGQTKHELRGMKPARSSTKELPGLWTRTVRELLRQGPQLLAGVEWYEKITRNGCLEPHPCRSQTKLSSIARLRSWQNNSCSWIRRPWSWRRLLIKDYKHLVV